MSLDEAIIRAALDRVTEGYLLKNGVAVATTHRADALAALDRLTAALDRLTASTTSEAPPAGGASGTAATDLARCEKRLNATNEDRAHWRARAISAEQALALYGPAGVSGGTPPPSEPEQDSGGRRSAASSGTAPEPQAFIRAVLADTEPLHAPGPCARCGRDPAAGFASIGDDWYCHGDFDAQPTCYMLGGLSGTPQTAKPSLQDPDCGTLLPQECLLFVLMLVPSGCPLTMGVMAILASLEDQWWVVFATSPWWLTSIVLAVLLPYMIWDSKDA